MDLGAELGAGLYVEEPVIVFYCVAVYINIIYIINLSIFSIFMNIIDSCDVGFYLFYFILTKKEGVVGHVCLKFKLYAHAAQQETVHAQLPQGLQLVPFHHGLASSVHLVHLETVHVQLP
jgi:hypothetical protein